MDTEESRGVYPRAWHGGPSVGRAGSAGGHRLTENARTKLKHLYPLLQLNQATTSVRAATGVIIHQIPKVLPTDDAEAKSKQEAADREAEHELDTNTFLFSLKFSENPTNRFLPCVRSRHGIQVVRMNHGRR